jgi:hypothetical protein
VSPKELEEENVRLTRDLNNMIRSYSVMEAEVKKLTQERDGLLDTVERLSLDLHFANENFVTTYACT